MENLGRPIGNISGSEDLTLNYRKKNILGWRYRNSCNNVRSFLGCQEEGPFNCQPQK